MDMPRVDYEKLASDRAGEASEAVRQRVLPARERQLARFNGSGLTCNADMGPAHIREYCELDETSKALMRSAMNQLGMSARAFHRVLKLGRTIADLAGAERIQAAHLAEAVAAQPVDWNGVAIPASVAPAWRNLRMYSFCLMMT